MGEIGEAIRTLCRKDESSMTAVEQYEYWKKSVKDKKLFEELLEISTNKEEVHDRFYRELEFGTGGLRGLLGVGSNRMNIYTVQKATQGLANYLKKHHDSPSVVIGYDSRINSTLFSKQAAEVLASNGIKVFLFSELIPTPTVSFAVRYLHCDAGIMVTASHNPAPYNGYKVYGKDGCQITTEAAKLILNQIDEVDPFCDVPQRNFEQLESCGTIQYVSEDVIENYLNRVKETSVLPDDIPKDLSIVYSPLCGSGISCVPQLLKQVGYTSVHLVPEQSVPDGTFPTCPKPNPEEEETLALGIQLAQNMDSDLVLATDPDCDRVGVAIRTKKGFSLINGNEMGVLLLEYLCTQRVQQGSMPKNPVAVSTIVTTSMAKAVAEHFGVTLITVLTGFKFIGEQIGVLTDKGEESSFIFGFEESYGYLSTTEVRDKDAVNASLLICDMVAFYKSKGKTLIDVLGALYQQYGYYKEKLLSFSFYGEIGFQTMTTLMDTLRNTPLEEINGVSVKIMEDYQKEFFFDLEGNKVENNLPSSNVLKLVLDDGTSLVLRPSGTEPKLKMYLSVKGSEEQDTERRLSDLERFCKEWIGSYE